MRIVILRQVNGMITKEGVKWIKNNGLRHVHIAYTSNYLLDIPIYGVRMLHNSRVRGSARPPFETAVLAPKFHNIDQ